MTWYLFAFSGWRYNRADIGERKDPLIRARMPFYAQQMSYNKNTLFSQIMQA